MTTTGQRGLLPTRSALLLLCITALFALSVWSVALYAKSPSFEETVDFIILRLSGDSVLSTVQCDRVLECRGFIDTAWQSRIAQSLSFCSIEVIQTVNVTKNTQSVCAWTEDVIGGKLWNQVTYQREYHFLLDLRRISRDGITVEQVTPEIPHCFIAKPDRPYSIHLNFTKGIDVSLRIKAMGSGNGDKTTSEQTEKDTWHNASFTVGSEDTAERLARAFKHAAALCGAKKEIF